MKWNQLSQLAQTKGYKNQFTIADEDISPQNHHLYGYLEAQLIVKWLRNKHNIHIVVRMGIGCPDWWYYIILPLEYYIEPNEDDHYNSYEEALVNAIVQALKEII